MDLKIHMYHRLPLPEMPKSTLKIMKLTAIILLAACMQVNAKGYSQITLSEHNAPLQKVFQKIQRQSGYDFVSTYEVIKEAGNVTVNVRNVTLQQALEECLKGKSLTYTIIEKTVVIQPQKKDRYHTGTEAVTETLAPPPVEIRGRVVNENGEALQNASVIIVGTNIGTTTNNEGRFTLTAPDDKNVVLEISSVGYQVKKVSVGTQKDINIVLESSIASLNQIVVIGFGTTTKRELTGAVSSIKAEDLQKVTSSSFTSAIQGKIPGVYISHTSGAPGGASSVRIRGVGTTGLNEPLYVIDGFPIGGGSMSIPGSSDKIDGLSIINPNDIESIEVLKDAASAAVYGARAANGVILITTKRGKSGNAKATLNVSAGVQQLWKNPQFLNAEEFATLTNELFNNSGMTPNPEWADPASLGRGTDWIDLVFRKAPVQNYDFSVSGGTQKLKTSLSLSYTDQAGTMIETFYKRYTGRVTVDLKVNDKINFGGALSFAASRAKGQQNSVMNYGIFNLAQEMYPTLGPDAVIGGSSAYFTTQGDNPVLRAKSMDNRLKNLRIFGNVFGEYEILDGLKFRTNIGLDADNGTNTSWNPSASRGFYVNPQAVLGVTSTQGLNWLIENTLSYNHQFDEHKVSAVLGQTAQKNNNNWISVTARDFPNEQLRVVNSSTLSLSRGTGTGSDYTLASYLGRINYSFKDKYLLSVSLRRDGSSNFGPRNKWGNFYAASGGWNIGAEEFMKDIAFISSLKLRGSWGQLGNDAIGSFGYLSTIRSGSGSDNYVLGVNQGIVTGATISRPGNPDLKWETSEQVNIGIDASFFKEKLYLTTDYYIKNTIDMLVGLPVSMEAGFQSAPVVNGGKVQNKGFELLLGYKDDFGAFHFDISGNMSTLKNRVISLGIGRPITGATIQFTSMSASYTEEGEPIGYYRGYIVDGIYQTYEEVNKILQPNAIAGDFKFRDINGDNQLSDLDKVKLGKPWPNLMYGMNLNLLWKGLDLNLMLQGISGNQIFHSNKFSIYPIKYFGGTGVVNAVKDVLNRWTPEKGGNTVPGLKYVDANGNYANLSSFYIEDGAYMRVRNVVLGYTIPAKVVQKTSILQNVRIYISAQNLFTFTKYSGFDPEMGSTNPIRAGIDDGVYPLPRIFMAGVNVSF